MPPLLRRQEYGSLLRVIGNSITKARPINTLLDHSAAMEGRMNTSNNPTTSTIYTHLICLIQPRLADNRRRNLPRVSSRVSREVQKHLAPLPRHRKPLHLLNFLHLININRHFVKIIRECRSRIPIQITCSFIQRNLRRCGGGAP